jgi:hypothetical protein
MLTGIEQFIKARRLIRLPAVVRSGLQIDRRRRDEMFSNNKTLGVKSSSPCCRIFDGSRDSGDAA